MLDSDESGEDTTIPKFRDSHSLRNLLVDVNAHAHVVTPLPVLEGIWKKKLVNCYQKRMQ